MEITALLACWRAGCWLSWLGRAGWLAGWLAGCLGCLAHWLAGYPIFYDIRKASGKLLGRYGSLWLCLGWLACWLVGWPASDIQRTLEIEFL